MFRHIALATLVAASHAAAQSPSLEERRRNVDRALTRIEAAKLAMRRDSIRVSALPLVREYAGMQIRGDTTSLSKEFMQAMDAAFQKTRADALALIGPRAHATLSGMTTSIVRGSEGGISSDISYVTLRTEPHGARGHMYQTVGIDPPDHQALENQFQHWYEAGAADGMALPMRRWLGAWFALHPPTSMNGMFRTLAISQYKSASACLKGSLRFCRSLMSVEASNDTIASWLDASERRQRVQRYYPARTLVRRFKNQPDLLGLANECVVPSGDAACISFLRRVGINGLITRENRREVLRLAIAMGGQEAYERLSGTTEQDIGRILEVTAGVPLDSVISTWQRSVVDAKPNSPAPTSIEWMTSVALGLIAIAASLGRRP